MRKLIDSLISHATPTALTDKGALSVTPVETSCDTNTCPNHYPNNNWKLPSSYTLCSNCLKDSKGLPDMDEKKGLRDEDASKPQTTDFNLSINELIKTYTETVMSFEASKEWELEQAQKAIKREDCSSAAKYVFCAEDNRVRAAFLKSVILDLQLLRQQPKPLE